MSLTDSYSYSPHMFLGVWEEAWQVRAEQVWKVERYHTWLRRQGASRDNAAEQAVRLLARGDSIGHFLDHPLPHSFLSQEEERNIR